MISHMIVNKSIIKDFYLDLYSNDDGSKVAFTKVNNKDNNEDFVDLFIYDCSNKNKLIKSFICSYSKLRNLKLVWYKEYLVIASEDSLEVVYNNSIIHRVVLEDIKTNSIFEFLNGIVLQSGNRLYFIELVNDNINLKKIENNIILYTVYENLIYVIKLQSLIVIDFVTETKNEYKVSQNLSSTTKILYDANTESLTCFLFDNKESSCFRISRYGEILTKQLKKVSNSRIVDVYAVGDDNNILIDEYNNLFKYKNYRLTKIFSNFTKVIDVYFSLKLKILIVSAILENGTTKLYKINPDLSIILSSAGSTLGKISASKDLKIIYYLNSYKGNLSWNLNLFSNLKNYDIEMSENQKNMSLHNILDRVMPFVYLGSLKEGRRTVVYFVGPQHQNIVSGQHQFFQHIHFSLLDFLSCNNINVLVIKVEDFDKISQLLLDIKKTIGNNVYFIGGSLSGMTLIKSVAKYSGYINGVVLINPVVEKKKIPSEFLNYFGSVSNAMFLFAKKEIKNFLIYQAANDEVIDTYQVSEFTTSLKRCKNLRYITVWDEGHIFQKKETWLDYLSLVVQLVLSK